MRTLTNTALVFLGLSFTSFSLAEPEANVDAGIVAKPAASAEAKPAATPETKDPKDPKEVDGDRLAVGRCLAAWKDKHPFGTQKTPEYKVMGATVQVLGIGDDMTDEESTKEPRLVLVKPTVAVLSKSSIRLMNPNGWYCLKANVTVLAKTVIEVACNASIADSRDGVAVLGSNSQGTGKGVTVLGKTELKRQGCAGGKKN